MQPFLKKHYDIIHTLFFRFGIANVSMDDIAKNTHTSKKTIYKEYKCKDELVKELFISDYQYFELHLKNLEKGNANAIAKTFVLYNRIHKKITSISPSVLYDLKKYYPDLFNDLIALYKKSISSSFISVLKCGKVENLFIQKLNTDSIANLITFLFESHLYCCLIEGAKESIFNPNDLLDYHFRSICTSLGIQRWEMHKQQLSHLLKTV